MMIPSSLKPIVLQQFHENLSHTSAQKCYDLISRKYHWKNIYKEIVKHCLQDCTPCRENNLKQEITPLQETLQPNYRFQICYMDIVGPLPESFNGNTYILSFIDQLARMLPTSM